MIVTFIADATYKTRSGKKAKVYTDSGGGAFPVHGAILQPGNGWEVMCWTAMGWRVAHGQPHTDDLVGVWDAKPARRTAWVSATGVVGLFEENQVPSDVIINGSRAHWLDEPVEAPKETTP